MSPSESAARQIGATGLADAIRDICRRKVPSDFGRVPELDQLQKAEFYLAHFGWRHACGQALMPGSVADMAALFEMLMKPHMRWKDAIDRLAMQKHLATIPDLTEAERDAIIAAEAKALRRLEEMAGCKATDRFIRERNEEPSP